ncbi:hypothetical protein B4098_2662 [Heyndrickxia coagulans]|uniref:Uncharacterized protein n=1 Tax=Heyndrickxia coagulans TaxID=1398 RepID=A0A150KJX9_HEYCO|nr:hypothetical protein B4098_2662 [Heyndrickxia coagulans]KYC73830.1 hypothetical protein B4099_2791 [Heyndrickxia coagulans]
MILPLANLIHSLFILDASYKPVNCYFSNLFIMQMLIKP